MAGAYTMNDDLAGVWNTPANTGIVGAVTLPITLSDAKQGGIQGASPDEAFRVSCGLGSTMTADDLLNGDR